MLARFLFVGLFLAPSAALAFSSGPSDGLTGAPGEGTCIACHSTFPLNSGSGGLSLAGLPEDYVPGETYAVTLSLADPDGLRWGFELTVLDDAGARAGLLAVTDAGTQLSDGGSRDYLKHNSAGTAPGTPDQKDWTFDWTAPDAGAGPVTVYVAGNAADNNGSNAGDRIYATSFATAEGTGVAVDQTPLALQLHGAAPNPFNPRTEIRFATARAGVVRVTVLTMDGRRVDTLTDGVLPAGSHAVAWDGRSHADRPLGSGTYLYVVEVGDVREVGRMTLIK